MPAPLSKLVGANEKQSKFFIELHFCSTHCCMV
eukprot:SAG31_NODE_10942_length_1080_cov_1.305810_2_plen_32_part_01